MHKPAIPNEGAVLPSVMDKPMLAPLGSVRAEPHAADDGFEIVPTDFYFGSYTQRKGSVAPVAKEVAHP